jgi:protein-S-isoprenylcysteine O-methyltransferase Ste14
MTTSSFPTIKNPKAFDAIERVVVILLYLPLCWKLALAFWETGNVAHLILLVSEGATVAFVLVRRSTDQISLRSSDWLLAVAGTAMPLLARPVEGEPMVSMAVCGILMLLGLALQISAKLTLRRSFGIVAANRGIKIGGPYGVVRHPMYAGYTATHVGFLLLNPSLWNASVYLMGFALQVLRICAEERILSGDDRYREFSAAVRYRLVPGVF